MKLEIRLLLNLLAIAQAGSFSRAAATLGVTQPSLTSSINRLERQLGAQVLERGRHGARPTELGQMLVRHASMLGRQLAKASAELEHRQQSIDGPLSIGVTPVAAASLVPRAIGMLMRQRPSVAIAVRETVFNEAVPALIDGTLDLMVGPIGVYPAPGDIVEERLGVDPLSVVVRAGHALCRRRSLSLKTLKDVAWVLPSDRSAYHRQIEALFLVVGFGWPMRAITTNSMPAMKAIVAHSECVAIMPKQLVAPEHKLGQLIAIRLAEAGGTRALGISVAKSRSPTPLTQEFIEILRRCM
jgi:molybdate transport repressor ModE-like protein